MWREYIENYTSSEEGRKEAQEPKSKMDHLWAWLNGTTFHALSLIKKGQHFALNLFWLLSFIAGLCLCAIVLSPVLSDWANGKTTVVEDFADPKSLPFPGIFTCYQVAIDPDIVESRLPDSLAHLGPNLTSFLSWGLQIYSPYEDESSVIPPHDSWNDQLLHQAYDKLFTATGNATTEVLFGLFSAFRRPLVIPVMSPEEVGRWSHRVFFEPALEGTFGPHLCHYFKPKDPSFFPDRLELIHAFKRPEPGSPFLLPEYRIVSHDETEMFLLEFPPPKVNKTRLDEFLIGMTRRKELRMDSCEDEEDFAPSRADRDCLDVELLRNCSCLPWGHLRWELTKNSDESWLNPLAERPPCDPWQLQACYKGAAEDEPDFYWLWEDRSRLCTQVLLSKTGKPLCQSTRVNPAIYPRAHIYEENGLLWFKRYPFVEDAGGRRGMDLYDFYQLRGTGYDFSFSRVQLSPDITEHRRIEEEYSASFVSVVSTIGGNAGLWLGASLVSLAQVLYHLFHAIRGRPVPKESTTSIAGISFLRETSIHGISQCYHSRGCQRNSYSVLIALCFLVLAVFLVLVTKAFLQFRTRLEIRDLPDELLRFQPVKICHRASIGNFLLPGTMPSGSVARLEEIVAAEEERTGLPIRSLLLWASGFLPELESPSTTHLEYPSQLHQTELVEEVEGAFARILNASGYDSFPSLVYAMMPWKDRPLIRLSEADESSKAFRARTFLDSLGQRLCTWIEAVDPGALHELQILLALPPPPQRVWSSEWNASLLSHPQISGLELSTSDSVVFFKDLSPHMLWAPESPHSRREETSLVYLELDTRREEALDLGGEKSCAPGYPPVPHPSDTCHFLSMQEAYKACSCIPLQALYWEIGSPVPEVCNPAQLMACFQTLREEMSLDAFSHPTQEPCPPLKKHCIADYAAGMSSELPVYPEGKDPPLQEYGRLLLNDEELWRLYQEPGGNGGSWGPNASALVFPAPSSQGADPEAVSLFVFFGLKVGLLSQWPMGMNVWRREVLVQGLEESLGLCGGLLGLFTGASIISLLHIAAWPISVLASAILRCSTSSAQVEPMRVENEEEEEQKEESLDPLHLRKLVKSEDKTWTLVFVLGILFLGLASLLALSSLSIARFLRSETLITRRGLSVDELQLPPMLICTPFGLEDLRHEHPPHSFLLQTLTEFAETRQDMDMWRILHLLSISDSSALREQVINGSLEELSDEIASFLAAQNLSSASQLFLELAKERPPAFILGPDHEIIQGDLTYNSHGRKLCTHFDFGTKQDVTIILAFRPNRTLSMDLHGLLDGIRSIQAPNLSFAIEERLRIFIYSVQVHPSMGCEEHIKTPDKLLNDLCGLGRVENAPCLPDVAGLHRSVQISNKEEFCSLAQLLEFQPLLSPYDGDEEILCLRAQAKACQSLAGLSVVGELPGVDSYTHRIPAGPSSRVRLPNGTRLEFGAALVPDSIWDRYQPATVAELNGAEIGDPAFFPIEEHFYRFSSIKLSLSPRSELHIREEQSLRVSGASLVGILGSHLGLFLGASIISSLTFTHRLLASLWTYWNTRPS